MTALKTRPASAGTAYTDDFYTWTQEQGARLRAGDVSGLDRENLADEIESLGRSQFASLVSALRVVLLHMLKIDCDTIGQRRSWAIAIILNRRLAADEIEESPGLRRRLSEAIRRAYRDARLQAADEIGLSVDRIPESCPYTDGDILDRPFPIDPDEAA